MSEIESNCGEFATVKPLEFERFKNEAGSNYFDISPQRWVFGEKTDKGSA
jgi:hypothetical protein